jgi:uncharacterized RDD family membrane protein YckC
MAGETSCTLCGAPLTAGAGVGGPVAFTGVAAGVGGAPAWAGAPAVRYGGFTRRLAGLLVDSCVLFFPTATVRVGLGLEPLSTFDPTLPAAWVAAVVELWLGWIYAAVLISSAARGTLGQQVMDLRVTDLHGGRVSFGRATWRYWAQALTLLTLGVGYLIQPATPRRQTLHDLVSGTLVVRPARASRPSFVPAAGTSP